jgi:hypothetical protein
MNGSVGTYRFCGALVCFCLLMLLSGRTWAHGMGSHLAPQAHLQTPLQMDTEATKQAVTKAEQASQNHEHKGNFKNTHQTNGTCVDCHHCCALRMGVFLWRAEHTLSHQRPYHRNQTLESESFIPELRPPIEVA